MGRSDVRRRRPLPPHVIRYTRMVAAMRLALPTFAALLLAALVAWSKFGLDGDRFLLAMGALGARHIESLSMNNPHFAGVDDKKRPFSLTAKQATQEDNNGDIIDLASPQADITLEDGAWLSLSSDKGRYRREARLLDLDGVVNLFHDQGYEMHTRDVRVNLAQGKAVSKNAVQGQGPAGDLTAEGIEVLDGGKRVLLLGRSHVVLNSSDQLNLTVPPP
jgi:lipopolysaccharide export system protein LptC